LFVLCCLLKIFKTHPKRIYILLLKLLSKCNLHTKLLSVETSRDSCSEILFDANKEQKDSEWAGECLFDTAAPSTGSFQLQQGVNKVQRELTNERKTFCKKSFVSQKGCS
jgi:hypothetical protein